MTQTEPGRAGRREWIGLAVLALACLLYVMDLTVAILALVALRHIPPTSDDNETSGESDHGTPEGSPRRASAGPAPCSPAEA